METVPLRILAFEDNPEDLELSLRVLRGAGFDVTADVVLTLEELERRVKAGSYDILLSDYRMPRATGMEAFEIVQGLGTDLPFVLVTGYLGDEMAVECLKRGVSDYVLKDRLARLPSAVQRAIEEKRLRAERRRAEEALRHSEEQLRQRNQELEEQYRQVETCSRMKSEFLANMSHELRSPLNGIIGFSELLSDSKLGPVNERQQECLGRILTGARHLVRLINDVLDLARIEAGKLSFQPEPVALSRLVAEVCESLAAVAAEKQILIESRVFPEMEAMIDPARLKQILYNYLSNALKFTPEGGRVTVTAKPEGMHEFRLEVNDNGPGIAEADQRQLFTNFHQIEAGKGKRFQGTGLGLALTRRIVEAQGGRVGVHSVVGAGSTFFAVLPRVSDGSARSVARRDFNCR
ncbi:MAG TPA: hybrid sensor histidine kinase/response regulator [Bryobacteraceae bacterium]|nr:hybrid sensor histidine kinase/response regulator [Bryobacteraceae bacterium]